LKKGVEQAWPVCFQRVKISGVTFIRNGNASLRAVHLLAVAVCATSTCRACDGTLESVRAIADPKLRVLESEWEQDPTGTRRR
jgi:hypothetical protein